MDNEDQGGLDRIISLVKGMGELQEWWDDQPKTTPRQNQILDLFYQLSQERRKDAIITEAEIHYLISLKGAPYPNDLMVGIIKELDRHYLEERNRRMKAKMRNQQNG